MPRGQPGEIPADEAELATEIPRPLWMAIVIALEERGLTRGGTIVNFDKRNYGNSTLRVRAFRARQRQLAFHETLQSGENYPQAENGTNQRSITDGTLQRGVETLHETGVTRQTDRQTDRQSTTLTEKAVAPVVNLFNGPLEWLMSATGKSEQQCRALIGRFRKGAGDDGAVFNAMTAAQKAGAVEPVSYITAALKPKPKRRTEQMPL